MASVNQLLAIILPLLLIGKPSICEIVEIEDGKIEGIVMRTRYDEEFDSFLGIPYAMPPLGELRFRAPVEAEPWSDVLKAFQFSPMCMQFQLLSSAEVSEDCLYLNVFTKKLPINGSSGLSPVVVLVHGGAFQLGSASDHQPHFLMERDLVLVTINYRIGAFGFLSLGTKEIPGNAGMKDQVLALKWIQKNIRHFGGDPNKVTLMGNSAGAYSVTAHMVSPMSQGLFHRVVAFSGAITYQRKLETNYYDLAKTLAVKMNCEVNSTEEIVACLREVNII